MRLTNIRDLMTPEDALEMEERYEAVLKEYEQWEDQMGLDYAAAVTRKIFDHEEDLPGLFD
mgnify:CR=1 FL=1|jgi:hypothetical protein